MIRCLPALIALAFLLWGCASPPREELKAARKAVAQAYAAGAGQLAPTEFQAADTALRDAETLVRERKYSLAKEIIPFVEAHAQRAVLKTQEEQANLELRRIREEMAQRERVETPQREDEEGSPRRPTAQTKQAITASIRPAPSKPAPTPPPLARYTVGDGETLWTIAARKDVYLDPLLWPLLYRANRDQIKDPRQIYPGQVLTIPRSLSPAEIAEAREKARKSEIFPVEILLRDTPSRRP